MTPDTSFSAQRTEINGRMITRLFTVEKATDTGIALCVCHKVSLNQYQGPDREAVLNDKVKRAPYMPKIKVAFRANFKRRKSGIWTDTAKKRPGGASRWVIVGAPGLVAA